MFRRFLIVALLTFNPPTVLASLPNATPPIFQFKPDIKVFPQNFSVAIDQQSSVFVGNSDGVLIYDGDYWQLVKLDNEDIARSVKTHPNGRVYVGGYDAFGYIERQSTGQFRYQDLTRLYQDMLDDELFADIWRIEFSEDAVYFIGLNHAFRYEPATESINLWRHDGSFGAVAFFQQRLLLQFRGEGLRYYEDGQWVPIDAPGLETRFVTNMVNINDQHLLIISPEDTWMEFDGKTLRPAPEYDEVPYRGSITSAVMVTPDILVLTTQMGKLVYTSLREPVHEIVSVGTGFMPGVVVAQSGHTLTVDDLGVYAIRYPARWRKIDNSTGLVGSVHQIRQFQGETFVLTSSGSFRNNADVFSKADWTDYEAWDLLPLADGSFLFADSYEIQHRTHDALIKVVDSSTTARVFSASDYDSDTVYVGTEMGLQVLRFQSGEWHTVYRNDKMDNLRITQIIELSANELLIGSERGGVRLLIRQTGDNSHWQFTEQLLGSESGIRYGASNRAYLSAFNDRIVASTEAGLFELRGREFSVTSVDGLAGMYPAGEIIQINQQGSELWAHLHDRLFRKNGHWVEENIRSIQQGAISVVTALDGQTVIGGLGNLLLFDITQQHEVPQTNQVRLTGATVYSADDNAGRSLPLEAIALSSSESRLVVRYALTDFNDPNQVQYRTRLLPRETSFSPWTTTSQQALVTLAAANYQFEIQAMDSRGGVSSLQVPISIAPQWFEHAGLQALAILLLLLLTFFLATVLTRRRSQRLIEETERLEKMVSQRTRALESANQQLDQMAHLDGLTQIPNRRRLDSYLDDVWQQCVERSRVMSIALIDVDHFKRYNDNHGHPAGDALLIELAKLLSKNLRRAEDLVARYGGEEFLVVMPGAEQPTALSVVEEMRRNVQDSKMNITISIGVYSSHPDASTPVSSMVNRADEALYQAKQTGRNRVSHN